MKTDTRALLYYKLTLSAFVSGELKKQHQRKPSNKKQNEQNDEELEQKYALVWSTIKLFECLNLVLQVLSLALNFIIILYILSSFIHFLIIYTFYHILLTA